MIKDNNFKKEEDSWNKIIFTIISNLLNVTKKIISHYLLGHNFVGKFYIH